MQEPADRAAAPPAAADSDRSEPREAARRAPRRRPWQRSVHGAFLAIVLPLALAAAVLCFALFEAVLYRSGVARLEAKLERLAQSQSIILAEPVWHRERQQIAFILAAIIADPDVAGAAVYDRGGMPLGVFGQVDYPPAPDLTLRVPITYADGVEVQTIGSMVLALTPELLAAAAVDRLALNAAVAALLLLTVVVSALAAHRRVIGVPLARLLAAIRGAEAGQPPAPVAWHRDDEIGSVIGAFNRLQARQQEYADELHAARESLERRVAERTAELTRARDEAERANRSKAVFLATMSHELRTPLNAIIGLADLLREEAEAGAGSAEQARFATHIHESGTHLLALINDLLDMTTAEAGKLALSRSQVDLDHLLDSAMSMLEAQAQHAGVRLERRVPADLPALWVDERRLRQVVLNLLSNAVKFTEAGGGVTVSAECADDAVRIQVADTGIGIAAHELERVLQPFAQVDTALNRRHQGSGLGLALTRKLVELHGGTLTLESEPEVGTTATARFPRAAVVLGETASDAAD